MEASSLDIETTVGTRVLTDADIAQFLEDGVVILRGLLSPEQVRVGLEEWSTINHLHTSLKDPSGGAGAREPLAIQKICQEVVGAAAADLLYATEVPAPLEELPNPILVTIPNPHDPDARWDALGNYPHTDNLAPTLVAPVDLAGFVFLHQVRHAAGAFQYAPGSARRVRAWMSRNAFESAWERARTLPVGGRQIEFLAEPGDVILFDTDLIHGNAPANSTGPDRQAIRLTFSGATSPPGPAPEQLPLIERARSLPFLRERFGGDFALVEVGDANAELADGFGPVEAYDHLRVDGRTFRFWVRAEEPHLIQRAVSDDLATWEPLEALDLVGEAITGLHLDYWWHRPRLGVMTRDRYGATTSTFFDSPDLLGRWRELACFDGRLFSNPDFIMVAYVPVDFRAKGAKGNVAYFVADQDPHQIFWKAGGGGEPHADPVPSKNTVRVPWPESDRQRLWLGPEGHAHRATAPVTDLFVSDTCGHGLKSRWGLVADLDGAAHFTMSPFADEFTTPMRPVTVEDGSTPSRLRCFERAVDRWLVTYLVEDRMYWGEIDWNAGPGHIRPIETAAGLASALGAIGLGGGTEHR